jgi:hypothetical protein
MSTRFNSILLRQHPKRKNGHTVLCFAVFIRHRARLTRAKAVKGLLQDDRLGKTNTDAGSVNMCVSIIVKGATSDPAISNALPR